VIKLLFSILSPLVVKRHVLDTCDIKKYIHDVYIAIRHHNYSYVDIPS
jgi:hypothetical protein